MILKDKVAIITGGGGGIGRATALALSKEGARVTIADVDLVKAKAVAAEVKEKGGEAIAVKVDVTDSEDIARMVEVTQDNFGRVDILVNGAGICQIKPLNELSEDDWDKMYSVNLRGTFFCSQAVLEVMKKQKSGKIINIASLGGEVGGIKVGANYAATKAGVICLTKSLAKYAAPYINVNAISPGFIDTEMIKGSGYDPNDVPLERIGKPEEVADVILFLASDFSRYITGANIDVNGGVYMG